MVGNVLRGRGDKRVTETGLEQLSTFGLLRNRPKSQVHAMIEHLQAEGYLLEDSQYHSLQLTALASQVLYQGKQVFMKVKFEPVSVLPGVTVKKLTAEESELLDELKELRGKLAKEAGIPAYVVFSNATLQDMAKKKPKTMSQFKKVSGVGEIKAAWYGTAFLKLIQRFRDAH